MSSRIYLSFDRFEDREEFESAYKGQTYKDFIEEFDREVFRKIMKYSDYSFFVSFNPDRPILSEDQKEFAELLVGDLRKLFWEMYKESCE